MSVFSNHPPRTAEASDQHVRAVLSLVGGRDVKKVLAETPAALTLALTRIPVEDQGFAEAGGQWSVAQVIHHLADTELVWAYRLRRILTEPCAQLTSYDQGLWAERFGYGEVAALESLEIFTALRAANLRLVKRASPAELRRTAAHEERGELTLEAMLSLRAGHDLVHLRQIERIRAAVRRGTPTESRSIDSSSDNHSFFSCARILDRERNMSEYVATVRWSRDEHDFVSNEYSRAHEWEFDGGVVVPASASPHHVPPPRSVAANVDPEEALVAAASSCHMLSFLAIAAKQRFIVDTYVDKAVGIMEEVGKDKYAISRVTLRPEVSFSGARLPSLEELERLHHLAHEYCFIANSLKAEITTEIMRADNSSSPV